MVSRAGTLASLALVALAASPAHATEPNTTQTTLFSYDHSVPLAVSWGKTVTSGGVTRRAFTFNALGRTRVAGYFVHPRTGAPWPLVLWTPGRGGDRSEELPDAVALARKGVASLLVDPPAPEVVTCNPRRDLSTFVRYVVGRRRAVDLALALPGIDHARVAAAGFSFGSSVTAVLAGVEPRIHSFALESGRAHHTGFMRLACAQLRKNALDAYVTRLRAIDPIGWAPRARHAAFLLQDGTRDDWNPRADVLALYRTVRGRKELRFYPAGHELNAAASAYRLLWLRRQLRP
jgi:cephalosporin-C deacetylase-like acetyl esterase